VIVYVETSAMLQWLLGQPDYEKVLSVLKTANLILSSELTIAECKRALVRGLFNGVLKRQDHVGCIQKLEMSISRWHLMQVTDDILKAVTMEFPEEPIRTLDAIHLVTAMEFSRAITKNITILTCDNRIQLNAKKLDFDIEPKS